MAKTHFILCTHVIEKVLSLANCETCANSSSDFLGTAYAPNLLRGERLKRVFDIDISVWPLCGGTLRVIVDITDPDTIQTILAHLRQRAPAGAVHRKKPEQRPEQGPQKGSLCRYMMV
tara:strand:+ start:651 stop:1004 length:354 start_codon:yes stop_codon:yes gene_type:complete